MEEEKKSATLFFAQTMLVTKPKNSNFRCNFDGICKHFLDSIKPINF